MTQEEEAQARIAQLEAELARVREDARTLAYFLGYIGGPVDAVVDRYRYNDE